MSHDQRLPRAGLWFAISLGLVTILGPAGTDMYLGSLPEMVSELGASTAQGQLTLTVYLLAMGVGQLFFGPIIDAVGRRWPLLIALAAFLLASVWAAMSATVIILLVARFVQGLAAAMTLVVAMSMVRDRASGTRAAQLFALLMTIEGLAPVLAPTAGGFVDAAWGWRAVLLVLAGLAAIALINTSVSLPESLPRSQRSSLRLGSVLRAYSVIIRDSRFLLPALGLSAVFFFLFVYIGARRSSTRVSTGSTPTPSGSCSAERASPCSSARWRLAARCSDLAQERWRSRVPCSSLSARYLRSCSARWASVCGGSSLACLSPSSVSA